MRYRLRYCLLPILMLAPVAQANLTVHPMRTSLDADKGALVRVYSQSTQPQFVQATVRRIIDPAGAGEHEVATDTAEAAFALTPVRFALASGGNRLVRLIPLRPVERETAYRVYFEGVRPPEAAEMTLAAEASSASVGVSLVWGALVNVLPAQGEVALSVRGDQLHNTGTLRVGITGLETCTPSGACAPHVLTRSLYPGGSLQLPVVVEPGTTLRLRYRLTRDGYREHLRELTQDTSAVAVKDTATGPAGAVRDAGRAVSAGGELGRGRVQQRTQLAQRGPPHRSVINGRQGGLAQRIVGQHAQLEGQFLGGERPGRHLGHALAVKAHATTARLGRNAMLFQEALHRIRVIFVQQQQDRAVGIGRSFQHRTCQPRREGAQELQGIHCRRASAVQGGIALRAGEQALALAQGRLDLRIARQAGFIADPQPADRLGPGLLHVLEAALGHQPGGLMREPLAALAGACGGVVAGAMHGPVPLCGTGSQPTPAVTPVRAAALFDQKMSKAAASACGTFRSRSYSCRRSMSSTFTHSVAPLRLACTMPEGGSFLASG